MLINNKLASMKQEEAQEYANNIEKLEELKKEFENEAKDRVKTTLIIDELAHKEGINVEDSEVTRTLYYEAIQTRQDPSKILEYYEKNNLLPVVKMSIIEDKVLTKILDRKAQKEGSKE
jgi:trigger factor